MQIDAGWWLEVLLFKMMDIFSLEIWLHQSVWGKTMLNVTFSLLHWNFYKGSVHTEKFTGHWDAAWWFFTKWTHLCNQDGPTEPQEAAVALPIPDSRFCGCVENLVCFLPSVNTDDFWEHTSITAHFSRRLIFTGSVFMLLVRLAGGWV